MDSNEDMIVSSQGEATDQKGGYLASLFMTEVNT